jgi:hypothetical protein
VAKATLYEISNFDCNKEVPNYLVSRSLPIHWPPVHRTVVAAVLVVPAATEGGEEPSAGTSSLTSEDKPEWSGDSPQDTEQSHPLPAPDAESPSGKGQATKRARSSSVSSTAGSTQETGASPASQSGSSEGQARKSGATQGQTDSPKVTPAKSRKQADS